MPAKQLPIDSWIAVRRRRTQATLALLLMSLAFASMFFYQALTAPNRLTLLVLSASYSSGWDVNPWVAEDVALLGQMDRRSLNLIPAGDCNLLADGNWTQFDEQILQSAGRADSPLLLYVNLHGGVDDQGQPCLIPPQALGDDARTWIRVLDVVKRIDGLLGDRRDLVLLLECGRLGEHSLAGGGESSFSSAIQSAFTDAADSLQFRSLSFLVAASSNQATYSDMAQGCDVFSRELALGIHGAADLHNNSGNADGFVQFDELAHYVRSKVLGWSVAHRETPQSVWSWTMWLDNSPSRTVDMTVRLSRPLEAPQKTPPPEADQLEIASRQWRLLAKLHSRKPWEKFPSEWKRLCDFTLGYEQVIYGGSGVRGASSQLAVKIAQQTAHLQALLDASAQSKTVEQTIAAAHVDQWRSLANDARQENAKAITKRFTESNLSGSVPLLQLLAEDDSNDCWNQGAAMQRYARLRLTTAERIATGEGRFHPRLDKLWKELASIERQIDDALLANTKSAVWVDILDEYENAVFAWTELQTLSSEQLRLRNELLSELPALAECLLTSEFEKSADDIAAGDSTHSKSSALDASVHSERKPHELVSPQVDIDSAESFLNDPLHLSGVAEGLSGIALSATSSLPSSAFADVRQAALELEDRLVLAALATARLSRDLYAEQLSSDIPQFDLSATVEQFSEELSRRWQELLRSDAKPAAQCQRSLKSLLSFAWFPEDPLLAAQLGSMRAKAWQGLRNGDKQLAETRTNSNATKAADSTTASLAIASKPERLQFSRFFAACFGTKANASSLSPAAMRKLIRTVRTARLGLSPESEMSTELSRFREADLQLRLAAGIASLEDQGEAVWRYSELQRLRGSLDFARDNLSGFWAVPKRDNQPYFSWINDQVLAESMQIRDQLLPLSSEPTGQRRKGATAKLVGRDWTRSGLTPSQAAEEVQVAETLSNCLSRIEQQLERCERSANSAFEVTAKWLPDLENLLNQERSQQSNWISQVRVLPTDTLADFPAGLASVQLRDGFGMTRHEIILAEDMEETEVPMRVDWLDAAHAVAAEKAEVALRFRGHDFSFSFDQPPSAGQTITAHFAAIKPTTLTIFDRNASSRRYTFVLDCSASMYAEAENEMPMQSGANGNPSNRFSKLDAASQALLHILERMVDTQDQVSVVLYGHRVTQGGPQQGRMLQTKYLADYPLPEPIEAYEDVEIVLPMGRFGGREMELVRQRLAGIVPWGQTPLFLAVSDALRALSFDGATTEHDIVVISDGQNYQFNPSPDKRISVHEVIEQARSSKARLHVVGFGVPEEQAAASLAQFEQLAHGTGGTAVIQIADAGLLSERLQALQSPAEFRIRRGEGSTQTGHVNEPLELDPPQNLNELVAADYRGKTYFFPLNAGDAIELSVDARERLMSSDYLEDQPLFESFVDGYQRPVELHLGVHKPRQKGNHVYWKFSFQNQNGTVARRPYAIIIEVEAMHADAGNKELDEPDFAVGKSIVATDRGAQRYVFADLNWTSGAPVPLIEFTTDNWPKDRPRARISAWCTDQPIEPAFAKRVSAGQSWMPTADLEVRWTETPSQWLGVLAARGDQAVENWILQPTWLDPASVQHRVNRTLGTSTHRFELGPRPTLNRLEILGQDPSSERHVSQQSDGNEGILQLISVSELKKRSITLSRPVQVEIAVPLSTLAPSR